MSVRLHIEHLVLDGIDVRPADRRRVVAAIESELARLVAIGGVPANGFAVPAVLAPQIAVAPGAKPAALGHAIAGAVYGGVRQ